MKYANRLSTTANLLVTLALAFAPIAVKAQTVISNEILVATTFVVNKTAITAKCNAAGCSKQEPMLTSIPVTCPAQLGQTCTFHIVLDAKVEVTFPCDGFCDGPGAEISYQFLVDGSAPNPGPVGANGRYLFSKAVWTASEEWRSDFNNLLFERQSYPASVLATVTNTSSVNHTIDVSLICNDKVKGYGCRATADHSTMRVDVFEP
jgi:hypothetical protein